MVQGFYFARLQYSLIQAFTACFVPSMQLDHQHRKTAHKALQGHFRQFDPFNRPRYQTDKSEYNAVCVTLYSSAQTAYYNKVYKGAGVRTCYGSTPDGAAYRRPCQPGGLQSGTGQRSGRTGWHPQPGGAVQQFGARRAARNHWRLSPYLFSGFRPIANRGQQ